MKRFLIIVLFSLSVTLAHPEHISLLPNTATPTLKGRKAPYSINTESRESLRRLGEMIRTMNPGALQRPVTIIIRESRPIVAAKDAHSTLRPLMTAACNAVGPVIRVVDLDPDRLHDDVIGANIGLPGTPAYNRAFIATNMGPFFVLGGHLTRWDERIDVTRRGFFLNLLFGLKGKIQVEPSLEFERENEISEMGMEFTLEDQLGFQVPYSQTEVLAALAKGVRSDRAGLLILGSGGKWTGNTIRSDGFHDISIRAVDLAVVESLGKLFKVPYWRCLPGPAEVDPVVMDGLKVEFESFSDRERTSILQRYLTLCGLPASDTGILDSATKNALVSFCIKRGLPKNDIPTPELYAELHLAMAMPFPTFDVAPGAAVGPSSGIRVEFEGFPPSYSARLLGMLEECDTGLRVTRDRSKPLHFLVIDYRGRIDKLVRHIHANTRRNCTGCGGYSLVVEDDHHIKVTWKGPLPQSLASGR